MHRQIVLDTETTGIRVEEGHRVIEIGCVELIDRKLSGRHFHYYLNPGRHIESGAQAVHGITNEFLMDKPLFDDIAPEFIEFIRGAELIIHNAPFDVGFLNHELGLTNKGWKLLADYCNVIDTLPMARQLHVGQRNSLDALCKRYAVDNSKRDLHGALLDANLLAQVYLAMTGGQGSFFDTISNTLVNQNSSEDNNKNLQINSQQLVTIKATEDELKMHQEYLEKMQQKGKCLWSELLNKETASQ